MKPILNRCPDTSGYLLLSASYALLSVGWPRPSILFAFRLEIMTPPTKKLLCEAVALLLLMSPMTSVAANGTGNRAFDKAMECYRRKEFKDAADGLAAVLVSKPDNSVAAYYAANAYGAIGNQENAKRLYWYVVNHCGKSREAYSSRALLKNIDPNYARNSTDPALAQLPKFIQGSTSSEAPKDAKHLEAEKSQLIERLVKLTPRRSNRSDISPTFIAEIKDALGHFPVGVLRLLDAKGCHIYLTPCVVEKDFRMEHFSPGGYSEGARMENVPALFDKHDVVMGQNYTDRYGNEQIMVGTVGILRHEIGHAIDWYLGHLSNQEEFRHAFAW
jgi:hypothetical protein